MKIIGCLNMREKDGGQSSVTVGCVYLPVSFFNACTSDYLRTERLFLQRPISPQMASRCFSYFAALLLEIRNIAFFIVRFSNLTKGRVFSSESKENVRCSLFQNGCNHLNYSLHSFLLLSKSVAANNKNLYRTASLFGRQALFADAFGCLNSWFNPGNLSRRLLRRNLLSNIGFFTLNQLSADSSNFTQYTGDQFREDGMMAEQKFFFILLLSGPCYLAIAPLFLFPKGERNSVSFTAPGLMLVGIAFVLIGCCGFVGLDSYEG